MIHTKYKENYTKFITNNYNIERTESVNYFNKNLIRYIYNQIDDFKSRLKLSLRIKVTLLFYD